MTLKEFFKTTSWWGKILGAFFGYLIDGAVGAILGLLIGNLFDRGLMTHFTNPHWHYHQEKRNAVQKIFFQATFSVMGYIAKADGRVTEQELNMARVLMQEMRLTQEQKKMAMHLFNEGKASQFNLNFTLAELRKFCHDNLALLNLFMDIQYRAAKTDGLSSKKIQALDTIFSQLGFAPFHQQYRFYEDFGTSQNKQQKTHEQSSSYSYSNTNYQPTKTNLEQAFALLEVTRQSSKQEVKRAYRKLLSQNHPDKLIAQGLPPEMIKVANEKTQKIVKAYQLICENKGWN